jgi:hypothetical protein
MQNGGGRINKEAIIIVLKKDGEADKKILNQLRQLGYKNLLLDSLAIDGGEGRFSSILKASRRL